MHFRDRAEQNFKNIFIYLFIYLSLAAWVLVAARRLSLAVVCRLLIVVASPCRAQALGCMGSVAAAPGL